MAARMIRSTVTRFVLIAGLAVALFVGSVAVGRPADASAAPMSCAQAMRMAEVYLTNAKVMLALGGSSQAAYWAGMSDGVLTAAC